MSLEIILPSLSSVPVRDFYSRMLLTRIVDYHLSLLQSQGLCEHVLTCCGHEAVQVGSASCIDIAQDVTLPYHRDLGVFLTLGMTSYEVFQTYLNLTPVTNQTSSLATVTPGQSEKFSNKQYLKYHKHNIVTGPSPVAMQVLHAAGIAFASKLRHAQGATIAYCDESTLPEADFREAITFAAMHKLPVVFICEHDYSQGRPTSRPILAAVQQAALPAGLEHRYLDGADIFSVYTTMQAALRYVREGRGPVLLEMHVTRLSPEQAGLLVYNSDVSIEQLLTDEQSRNDPLLRCRQLMAEQGLWDEQWANLLYQRFKTEVEQAMRDALRTLSLKDGHINISTLLYPSER